MDTETNSRTKAQWETYKALELIPETTETQNPLRNFAAEAWNDLLNLVYPNGELQIQVRCDRNGERWWRVSLPGSGQTFYFNTEAEVYEWLNQRYNHRLTRNSIHNSTHFWRF